MSALHRCSRCHSGSWSVEREDKTVVLVCLLCGTRVLIRDGRREAIEAEMAAVRGLHMKTGPKPRASGGQA